MGPSILSSVSSRAAVPMAVLLLASVVAIGPAGVSVAQGQAEAPGSFEDLYDSEEYTIDRETEESAIALMRADFGLDSDPKLVGELYDDSTAVQLWGARVSLEEASVLQEQMKIQAAFLDVVSRIELLPGYGGSWIDHSDGAATSIGVKGEAPEIKKFIDSESKLGGLRLVPVDRSYEELLKLMDDVSRELSAAEVPGEIGIEVETNRVVAEVEPKNKQAADDSVTKLGPAVAVQEAELPRLTHQGGSHSYNPQIYRSGLKITSPNTFPCSTAFMFYQDTPAFGRLYGASSAGHCAYVPDTVVPNIDTPVGTQLKIHQSLANLLEFRIVAVDFAVAASVPSDYRGHEVFGTYVAGPGTLLVVDGTANPSSGGVIVCSALGNTKRFRCGVIDRVNTSWPASNGTVFGFRSRICQTQDGDSGSGIFIAAHQSPGNWTADAMGVLSAAREPVDSVCNSTDRTYGSTVQSIAALMDWHVLVN